MSKCKHPDCSTSTSIMDTLTFGRGKLDRHGFWEIPCRPCARDAERRGILKEYMPFWPYEDMSK